MEYCTKDKYVYQDSKCYANEAEWKKEGNDDRISV